MISTEVIVLSLTCRDIIISIDTNNKQKRTSNYSNRDLDLYSTDLFCECFRAKLDTVTINLPKDKIFKRRYFTTKTFIETSLTLRFFMIRHHRQSRHYLSTRVSSVWNQASIWHDSAISPSYTESQQESEIHFFQYKHDTYKAAKKNAFQLKF